ncbi:peptidoglycan-binding protein [Crossiella cryophila]
MAMLALGTIGVSSTVGATPASACSSQENSSAFAATLPQVNQGDRSAEVRGMQLALKDKGYGLTGTGFYGDNTLAAVKDFQREHGIKDSGIVGSKTWQALVGRMPQHQTYAGEPPATVFQPGGHYPEDMFFLHNALNRINGSTGEYGDTYDAGTQAKVREFQRTVGLPEDAVVNAPTWRALYTTFRVAGRSGC